MWLQLGRALCAIVAASVLFAVSPAFAAEPPAADGDDPSGATTEGSEEAAPPSPATSEAAAPPPERRSSYVVRAGSEASVYGDTTHVYVLTPAISASIERPTAGWSVGGRFLVDVVTAASPDVVSTASPKFTEVRHAGGLDGAYKPGNTGVSLTSAYSNESDYFSILGGAAIDQDLDEKNWNLRLGYNFSQDTIGRAGTPYDVYSKKVSRHAAFLSVSRALAPSTLAVFVLDGGYDDGDTSKPYRYVPLFSRVEAARVPEGAPIAYVNLHRVPEKVIEQLPVERTRGAFTARLLHRFATSTLRLDERAYADTWELLASSTDVRWIFDLGRRWEVGPHLRFHAQSAVSFWERAYVSSGAGDVPRFRSNDRELGTLLSGTFGGRIRFAVGSDREPDAFVVGLFGDATSTRFFDSIYLTQRFALISGLTFEVKQ